MHFALQCKMAGLRVGVVVVVVGEEFLNGPINGDDCWKVLMFAFKKKVSVCEV